MIWACETNKNHVRRGENHARNQHYCSCLLNNINDEQIKNEVKKYENKIILFTYYFEKYNLYYNNTIKSEYKSNLNLSIIMISD